MTSLSDNRGDEVRARYVLRRPSLGTANHMQRRQGDGGTRRSALDKPLDVSAHEAEATDSSSSLAPAPSDPDPDAAEPPSTAIRVVTGVPVPSAPSSSAGQRPHASPEPQRPEVGPDALQQAPAPAPPAPAPNVRVPPAPAPNVPPAPAQPARVAAHHSKRRVAAAGGSAAAVVVVAVLHRCFQVAAARARSKACSFESVLVRCSVAPRLHAAPVARRSRCTLHTALAQMG